MSYEVFLIVIILAIPIFLISRWTFNKFNIGHKNYRNYLAIIPAIFLSPIVYFGLIFTWISIETYYPERSFDVESWKTSPDTRYEMSNDIIESRLLIGKSKEEVINILGDDFYTYGEDHIAYYLGFVPGLFNIDPDVLDIYFEDGVVIRVSQHET